MNTHTPISIFRAGRHLDQSGASLDFTEADLLTTAQGYDAALHEAPLVIGHPSHDAPAYGWVETLSVENGVLRAHPKQVDDSFSGMVAQGRFKKISASFYLPDSPRNPKPGIYYLRHVGFLGAQPPAVKGLPDAAFSDEPGTEIITLEFCDASDANRANLWERLRLWITTRFGQEEAETAIPHHFLPPHQHTANPTQESTPQERAAPASGTAATEALLYARNTRLQQAENALRQLQQANFVEEMIRTGRILPRDSDGLTTFLTLLSDQHTLSFGENEQEISPRAWFQEWIARLPPQVDFSEWSAPSPEEASPNFPLPPGYAADPAMLEIHRRATAYAKRHNVDYRAAVEAVHPT